MKSHNVIVFILILMAVTVPKWAIADTPASPHYGGGIGCSQCHTAQNSLGSVYGVTSIATPDAYNNICQTCHRPGNVFAGSKPFVPGDASALFGSHTSNGQSRSKQTSHRWNGSDVNPAAGALPPILPAMTSASAQGAEGAPNLRGRTGNQLACARCHTMHINPNNNGHLLRSANGQDEMCMDCHRTRNKQSHLSGTHPVGSGVKYSDIATANPQKFKATPENANPVNISSDLNMRLTSTGNLVCSTCHGVHYADSRSSTFDGASSAKGRNNYVNLSSADGYLLRTDRRGAPVSAGLPDKLNICTNCHAGKQNHNAKDQDVQCSDCHGTHVEYDKDDPNNNKGTNVFLIRRDAKKAGGASKIYFRYTGSQREYKNAEGTGVCQGCHDVPAPGGIYPPEHNSTKAADCNGCHYHSSPAGSFSGACTKCHGVPPTTLAGLANPPTNALGGAIGAHSAHYSKGMTCNACHYGYGDRTMPNKSVDLGFSLNPRTVSGFKGTNSIGVYYYDPANLVSSNYTFNGSGARDINQSPGSMAMTCNVYCHGNTLTPGANSTPSWIGGSTEAAFCDSCHSQDGNAMTLGSHTTHAGGDLVLGCSNCHGTITKASNHMNGSVRWDLSKLTTSPLATYQATGGSKGNTGETGRIAPSVSYGTCSNIVCHGQGAPTWGAKYTAPGNVFPYSSVTCGKCHSQEGDVTALKPFYSTAIPKVTANTNAKVGAHTAHIASTDNLSVNLTCNECHGTVAALDSAGHMNGSTDFVWGDLATGKQNNIANPGFARVTPTYLNGTCSSTYCHGATMTGGTNRNPSWNSANYLPSTISAAACGTCHGFPPPGHNFTAPTTFPAAAVSCNCHPNINPAGTSYADIFVLKSKHIDGLVEGGGCNGCHGYPPSNPAFVPAMGNYSFARVESYLGSGGSHTVAGHVSPTANASGGWANCTPCHTESDHVTSPKVFLPSSNIKVRINPRDRFSENGTAKYTSNNLDGALHVPGNCSNVSCHFQKSPSW